MKKSDLTLEEATKLLDVLTGDKEVLDIEKYADGIRIMFKDGSEEIIRKRLIALGIAKDGRVKQ